MPYCMSVGTYEISGSLVSLKLVVELNPDKSIIMKIPFPDNYPMTQLRERLTFDNIPEEHRGSIFYSKIWLFDLPIPKLRSALELARRELFGNEPRHPNDICPDCIFIEYFYVLPRLYHTPANPDERKMLSSLGKKSICKGFSFIMSQFPLLPEKTLIMLEAGGGDISNQGDRDRIKRYSQINREKLQTMIEEKFVVGDLSGHTHAKLAEMLVVLENNATLIQYYIKTYGFSGCSGIDKYQEDMPMATTLSRFVEAYG